MKVPFVDLKAQYQSMKGEMDAAIQDIIDRTAFIGGDKLKDFESKFAANCGVKHCIGVGNGTDALFIALKGLGIGAGDEVITAANSFIASSEPISSTGARVVFIDCDPVSYNIDIQKLTDYLDNHTNGKVKAIMPVHLYGQIADMSSILKLAEKYNLKIIEDSAQAHFADYNGNKAGSIGDVGCFSFYPGKNLGAYGDAGAIVTNNDELAEKIRMLANHGRMSKYDHEFEGVNSRLDGMQAAVLNVKMNYILDWNKKRLQNALLYKKYLQDLPEIQLPNIPDQGSHVFHLFVVRVKNRQQLQAYLKEKGIASGVHYPIALPNLKAYEWLGHKPEDFPIASQYQNEILSLPMFPELTEEQIIYVCDSLKKFIK